MKPKPKSAQHSNRRRRIPRRIKELQHEKADEMVRAKIAQREPVLGDIDGHIHSLQARAQELAA